MLVIRVLMNALMLSENLGSGLSEAQCAKGGQNCHTI